MKLSNLLTIIFAVFAFSTSMAQGDLISADEFMDLYKSSDDLVIIEASNPKTYNAAHIKKAIFVDHYDMYREDVDIPGILKAPTDLAAYFGSQGVNENSEIIVYDEGSQKYSTRVYFALKYIGAKNVKILHKDLKEWRNVRIPLTSAPAQLAATTFTLDTQEGLFANTDYVATSIDNPDITLLDLRSADEYNGIDRSEGHIPGAIHIDYLDLLTDTGAFKPKAEIETMINDLGFDTEKEVIVSCRTGIKAAVGFAALTNVLGLDQVRLYDGSYLQWVEAQKELIK